MRPHRPFPSRSRWFAALTLSLVSANWSACGSPATSAVSEADAADVAAGDDVAPADVQTDSTATNDAAIIVDPCVADPTLANPPSPPLSTPRWAFEPWISKDISNADDTRAFVQGFLDRDIPVGVVVLDSPWASNYNTYIPSATRYPEFAKLSAELHAKNVRIVLWTTSLVNESSYDLEVGGDTYDGPSPNFAEGKKCGHYVNDAELNSWWKGYGGSVDFFSPAARTWWNRQQLDILPLIDGYKLDFGEMYIATVPIKTADGLKSLDAYSSAYYHQMLAFGRAQRGEEFLTMVRPWDESYGFPGRFFANVEDAPVAWVGDNRRDWIGLHDALDHMLISAAKGYTMVGSDLGGYLDRNDLALIEQVPWNHKAFARWTAIGALGPFMQLHGRANLTPWSTPDHTPELLANYKYWAQWHHQMAPTLFAVTRRSQKDKTAPLVMVPVGTQATWKDDWRYILADRWLVAPLTDDSGKRDVVLPAGRKWLNWWDLDAAPLPGGTTVTADYSQDLAKVPLYLDACSVQPYADGTALTGLGAEGLVADHWWLVAVRGCGAAAVATCPSAQAAEADTELKIQGDGSVRVTTAVHEVKSQVFAVITGQLPTTVTYGTEALPPLKSWTTGASGWIHEAARGITWVRIKQGTKGASLVIQ